MSCNNIFGVRLENDPPVSVPPMVIEYEGSERPIKVRQCAYSPEQLACLKKKVQEVEKAGYVYQNNSSKWASAPLIVPKISKEGFQFTVDLRSINAQTKLNVWSWPLADPMLARLFGSKLWFNINFIHGYWQFPLAEDSQECQSFYTPLGVHTPTRVLHNVKNYGIYIQFSMEAMFGHINILIYIDDLLGYAKSPSDLLDKLPKTFAIYQKKGLKLQPKKCELLASEVQLCGRIISKKGIKFHPRQYEALTSMPLSTTVSTLVELAYSAN